MLRKTFLFSALNTLATHAARGCSGQWSINLLCGLGVWGLSAGATVHAQGIDLLAEAQEAFGHRLEMTLRYQEAVGPEGVRAITRCLRMGKRTYVLESYTATASGQGRVTERYLLQGQGSDTVSTSTARFLLGNEVTRQGKTACIGVFHHYVTPFTIEAGQVLVVRNFSPAALLALAPELVPTGQTLYVLNEGPNVRGDTLACYRLTWTKPGHISLTLQERQTAASRRWRNSTRITYRWEADLAQHQVKAMQVLADGMYGAQWVRTYINRTDFTESHFYFAPPVNEGDGMVKQEFYHREFKQFSPQQALDRYTLPLRTEPARHVTFDITHYYH